MIDEQTQKLLGDFQKLDDDIYYGKDGRYHLFILWVREGPNQLTHHILESLDGARSFLLGAEITASMTYGLKIQQISPLCYDSSGGPM